jgi:SAM-dependent methyltransferase
MFLNIILLSIILFLFFLLSMFWPPDSPWAPWWRTNSKTAKAIFKLAKAKKGDLVYDLGCGDGTALITGFKDYGIKGVGIEIDPLRYWISKIRVILNRATGKILIERKNLFNIEIKNADLVVVYLVPKTLERLVPKFKKELKKGTKIVSFVYEINLPLKEYDKKNKLRLYII